MSIQRIEYTGDTSFEALVEQELAADVAAMVPVPAEPDPMVALKAEYEQAALAASYGQPNSQERLEQAEAALEALERQRRRDAAALTAQRLRDAEEAKARAEAERLAQAERVAAAQIVFDTAMAELEKLAVEVGRVAERGLSAMLVDANKSLHRDAAERFRIGLFGGFRDPQLRRRFVDALGAGAPAGRNRPVQ